MQDTYRFGLAGTVLQVAPYLGFAVVAFFETVLNRRLSRPSKQKLKLAAVGGFAGVVAFTLLTVTLVSTQIPDAAQGASTGTVRGTSLDFGQLLVNSLILGLVGATIGSGVTYCSEQLPDQ